MAGRSGAGPVQRLGVKVRKAGEIWNHKGEEFTGSSTNMGMQNLMSRLGPPKREVMLEPFVHQVGGHSCILRFNKGTICKVLIPREFEVYCSLPEELKTFTPQYRVSVSVRESKTGSIVLIAQPVGQNHCSVPGVCCSKGSSQTFVRAEWEAGSALNSILKTPKIRDDTLEALKQPYVLRLPLSGLPATGDVLTQLNPWARHCYQRTLEKMRDSYQNGQQCEYLLLEDLTEGYRFPCVLDLKVGRRQHGEGASLQKQRDQTRKCQLSTSAALGIRVCGMQVFQLESEQMVFMNKYYGRSLTESGFRDALYQFFHSGKRLLREIIQGVLDRLRDLRFTVEKQVSYRFYSSSILIIHDGDQAQPEHKNKHCDPEGRRFDVRMIDFAHTTCARFSQEDGVAHQGIDMGYIFGLDTLMQLLSEILLLGDDKFPSNVEAEEKISKNKRQEDENIEEEQR
ncbi:IP6K2 kinase, partial [Polypterus senegalus]